MTRSIRCISVVFTLLMIALPALAQIPATINYQGRLENLDGSPYEGAAEITARLYDSASGGTALWGDTHAAVQVVNGIYSLILGTGQPVSGLTYGVLSDVPFDRAYYLELDINGEPLSDRQPLTSVPYAMKAAGVEGLTIKDGNVGIHTTSPGANLDVHGLIRGDRLYIDLHDKTPFSSVATFVSQNEEPPYVSWEHSQTGGAPVRYGFIRVGDFGTRRSFGFVADNGADFIFIGGQAGFGTTTPQYSLDVSGYIRGTNLSPSDLRWKEEVAPLDGGLNRVAQLRGVSFRWREPDSGEESFHSMGANQPYEGD